MKGTSYEAVIVIELYYLWGVISSGDNLTVNAPQDLGSYVSPLKEYHYGVLKKVFLRMAHQRSGSDNFPTIEEIKREVKRERPEMNFPDVFPSAEIH